MRLISALPPRLVELILLFLKPITGFTRTFESWDDALAASRSYEDPNIVEMYRNAMKNSASSAHLQSEVQQREARLAMAILRVVAENGMDKGISVLDVGGATGAHRNLFSKLGICVARYDIVESTAVVDELKEFSDSDKTWVYEPSAEGYDLVLCSGTLQVLREGIASLAAWANISGWIIIDRTPVTDDARTVIRRQNVLLPGLRRTSYPSWFFSRAEIAGYSRDIGKIILEWAVPEDSPMIGFRRQSYSGFLLDCRLGADGQSVGSG